MKKNRNNNAGILCCPWKQSVETLITVINLLKKKLFRFVHKQLKNPNYGGNWVETKIFPFTIMIFIFTIFRSKRCPICIIFEFKRPLIKRLVGGLYEIFFISLRLKFFSIEKFDRRDRSFLYLK
jgi:hypothetical protein